MVAGADTAIAPIETVESGGAPFCDVRRRPKKIPFARVERRGFVANVARGDGFRASNRDDSFGDDNPVHDDGVAGSKVASGEFVFVVDVTRKRESLALKWETFAASKIG